MASSMYAEGVLTPERDVELRERLRDHAVEVLSHQLQVERYERGRLARADVVGVGAVLGIGFLSWKASRRQR